MGEPIADFQSGLAVTFESDLERIEFVALLPVGIIHHHDPHVLQAIRRLDIAKRRLPNGFAGTTVEGRFWIKTFHVTDPSTHEQPNHILCFCRSVGMTETRSRLGLHVRG